MDEQHSSTSGATYNLKNENLASLQDSHEQSQSQTKVSSPHDSKQISTTGKINEAIEAQGTHQSSAFAISESDDTHDVESSNPSEQKHSTETKAENEHQQNVADVQKDEPQHINEPHDNKNQEEEKQAILTQEAHNQPNTENQSLDEDKKKDNHDQTHETKVETGEDSQTQENASEQNS